MAKLKVKELSLPEECWQWVRNCYAELHMDKLGDEGETRYWFQTASHLTDLPADFQLSPTFRDFVYLEEWWINKGHIIYALFIAGEFDVITAYVQRESGYNELADVRIAVANVNRLTAYISKHPKGFSTIVDAYKKLFPEERVIQDPFSKKSVILVMKNR